VPYWNLSSRQILQLFLSIGEVFDISIMMRMRAASKGAISARNFRCGIDNITKIGGHYTQLSRAGAATRSRAAGHRSAAVSPPCWTRRQQPAPPGAQPKHVFTDSAALTWMAQRGQANCQGLARFNVSAAAHGCAPVGVDRQRHPAGPKRLRQASVLLSFPPDDTACRLLTFV
jgi:hypothetical protein